MPPEPSLPPISKAQLWTGRILSALPVLLLVMSGAMKLMKPAPVVEGFAKYGYPAGAVTPIGLVELACTAIYLIPRTSVLGAILLTGYLGGATATHVRAGEPFYGAVLAGMAVWGGLFFRNPQIRALIPLRK